jgi:hypothetical protein
MYLFQPGSPKGCSHPHLSVEGSLATYKHNNAVIISQQLAVKLVKALETAKKCRNAGTHPRPLGR